MPKLNEKREGKFFDFFSKIKKCKMNDYIKLSTIVCSKKSNVIEKNQSFYAYMIGLKPKECFCSGKLKCDCGKDICSVNNKACKQIIANLNKSIKLCA